jgi:hypothetical protein
MQQVWLTLSLTLLFLSSFPTAVALVLNVQIRNGLPFVREGNGCYLFDTGSSITCVTGEPQGVATRLAVLNYRATNAQTPILPPGVDGIIGWNFISAWKKVTWDFASGGSGFVYLDEPAPFSQTSPPLLTGSFTERVVGSTGVLPCASFTAFGTGSCSTLLGVIGTCYD